MYEVELTARLKDYEQTRTQIQKLNIDSVTPDTQGNS